MDVSASSNVGRIHAQRCLETGSTYFFSDKSQVDIRSEKVQSFLQELKNAHISLSEPTMIVSAYTPGIIYDRDAEPKVCKEDYQDDWV